MENNYIIRLRHEGLPCWHIIRASRMKEPLLSKMQHGADVDVSTLGTILQSGWGKEIPPEILQKYAPDAIP